MSDREAWDFHQGDEIAPGLTAMKRLGGGLVYEAYLAFDERLYAPVVVKVVRPDQVVDEHSLAGMRREVEMLERVAHPSLVRHFRAVTDGERPHLVLEHIEGPRLSTLIRKHGWVPEQQYLPLAIELASAVHYLRELGVVHLDIKPSNIIMGAPAKLIDLSVARMIDRAQQLTYPVGTDAYMAPEQCDPPATGTPGHPSDVWGIGATLFHAIEGRSAFEGDPDASDPTVRFPQLKDPAPTFTRRIAPDVAEAVYACLTPDPAYRPLPQDVAEIMAPALERAPRGKLVFKVR